MDGRSMPLTKRCGTTTTSTSVPSAVITKVTTIVVMILSIVLYQIYQSTFDDFKNILTMIQSKVYKASTSLSTLSIVVSVTCVVLLLLLFIVFAGLNNVMGSVIQRRPKASQSRTTNTMTTAEAFTTTADTSTTTTRTGIKTSSVTVRMRRSLRYLLQEQFSSNEYSDRDDNLVDNDDDDGDGDEEEDMSSSSAAVGTATSKLYNSASSLVPFSLSLSSSSIIQLWEDIFLSPESAVKSPFRILKPEEEDEIFFSTTMTTSTSATTISSSNPLNHRVNGSNTTNNDNNVIDDEYNHDNTCTSSSSSDGPQIVHFCFLVHGHRGHSRDLSYVQAVMKRLAQQQQQPQQQQQQQQQQQTLIVHSVRCNEKKTDDGVIAGGTRLIEEMIQVIRTEMMAFQNDRKKNNRWDDDNNDINHDQDTMQTITISLWGNSLGGLYSRYALSLLSEHCSVVTTITTEQEQQQLYWILDNKYKIYLNVFCTTATPHLGISGHTFVSLPRRAEIGLATAMGTTGKDLFRINSILYDMATTKQYIHPLSLFRKRICYANAYGTDFPVPASTAAFLSDHSTYPHYVVDDDNDDKDSCATINTSSSLVQIATLYTSPSKQDYIVTNTDDTTSTTSPDIELAQMSTSLDSLGWKKVFVDMRKEVPHIVLPKSLIRRGSGTLFSSGISSSKNVSGTTSTESERSSTSSSDEEDDIAEQALLPTKKKAMSSSSSIPVEPIHQMLKKRRISCQSSNKTTMVLSSKDVAAAVSTSALLFDSNTAATDNKNGGQNDTIPTTDNDDQRKEQRDDQPNNNNQIGKVNSDSTTDDTHFAIHWPLGHNMIVAFSRSRWSAHMNKAGRPVVDALAKEIVDDIFAYPEQQQ